MSWTGRILPPSGFIAMPWKNGMGTTWEVARANLDRRSVVEGQSDWRLSLAAVEADAPFSSFPGYARFFCPVEGKDIGLHFAGSRETRILRTHESLIFSGDEAVTCHLPEGPVRCLNLMVLRDMGTFDAGLKRGGGAVAADVDARFFMALALAGGLRIEMVGYPSIALAEGHAFIAEKWSSLTAERPVLHVDGDAVGFYASIMAA